MAYTPITAVGDILLRRQVVQALDELDGNIDMGLNIAIGEQEGRSVVHKFGHNAAIGTSYEAISYGAEYQMPTPSSAITLRVAAGDANDDAAGTGARSVRLQGLDATGALIEETIATAGASAGAASTNAFMRLFRAYVLESGTHAQVGTGSHADDIVIEDSAGANTWATITATDRAAGQTEIGCYTVPLGSSAYLASFLLTPETSKTMDVIIAQRQGILTDTAPFPAAREVARFIGVTEPISEEFLTPVRFPALTDIIVLAKNSVGTAAASVTMEIILVEDGS